MSWLDFFVGTLAAAAIVDVWFNGSIFASLRAVVEGKAEEADEDVTIDEDDAAAVDDGEPLPLFLRIVDRVLPKFIADLLVCPFCFSHHTPWIVILLCFVTSYSCENETLAFAFKIPAYSLAMTRLGTLINAYAPNDAKYKPKEDNESEPF